VRSLLALLVLGGAACCSTRGGGRPVPEPSALATATFAADAPSARLATTVPPSGDAGPAATTAAPPPAGAAPTGAPTRPSVAAASSHAEAARAHDWERAHELLAALPAEERARPELRLALGRAALGARRHAEAVAALAGLEEALPALRDEVRRWYAEAAAMAGPYDEAARLLASSASVGDLLLAARAWIRAGDLGQARKLATEAVKLAQRAKRSKDEIDARLLRAELAEKAGVRAAATSDWTWIVREHPRDPATRTALDGIDRVAGRIDVELRLAALARSATPHNVDATLDALDALGARHRGRAALVAHTRARALYHARRYDDAVRAFDAVAATAPAFRGEAELWAAKSAARAGRHEDALARFDKLARARPGDPKGGGLWAERASFHRAEVAMVLGRHQAAADAFARHLTRFRNAESATAARHGRALALLGTDRPAEARTELGALRRSTRAPSHAAILQELEGVAALRAGDREGAVALWRAIVEERPLGWASLTARARLVSVGHEPPPLAPAAAPDDADGSAVYEGIATAAARAATEATRAPMAVALPEPVALLHALGLDEDAEARLVKMEREVRAAHRGRESEALCQMYGMLNGAHRRHQIGGRVAPLGRLPDAGELWAWRCVYAQPYAELVEREERKHELPAGLVHAVMRQESAFRREALSPAGAFGLMQLMPATAAAGAREIGLAVEGLDTGRTDVNVSIGAFYLGKMLRSFRGSLPLAVAAYNAGPHAVASWLGAGGERDVDVWVARIPYRETRDYVAAVLANFARYQYLAGGPAAVTPLALALPEGADLGAGAY
jgi:soluble lytic murein transglycosylase